MPRPVRRTSPLITAWLVVLLSCAALAAAPGSGAARAAVQPGDDWPLTRGNPARTAAAGAPGPGAPAAVVWQYRLPGGGDPQLAPPVVAGRSAFVLSGSMKGILSAVDVATGKHVWRSKAHYPLDTGLALVDDLVIAVEMEGFLTPPSSLVALDAADGNERWRVSLGTTEYVSTPTVADGAVFVGTTPGDVVALDAANGNERWRTRIQDGVEADPEDASPSVSPAAVANGAVVVVAATPDDVGDRVRRPRPERPDPPAGDVLVSLDVATGAERWRVPLEGFARATGPTVADGTVYVPVQSLEDEDRGHVLAVDAANGVERWRSTVEGSPDRPLAVDGDRVYLGLWSGSAERDTLVALETATGQEAWRVPEVGGAPVVAGDLVYAAGGRVRWGGTELVVLDARSGDERWRLDGVGGRIALADGVVYALGQTNLYAVAEGSPAVTSGATTAADVPADADPILAWGDEFFEDEASSFCAGGAEPTDPLDGGAGSAPQADVPGLWVVDPASGRNVTPGRESVAHPAWSPDGARIAFLDEGDGRLTVHAVGADGSSAERLSDLALENVPPVWFPDGERILVLARDDGALYAVAADGSGATRLTEPIEFSRRLKDYSISFIGPPAISPDGSRIAYTTLGPDGDGMEIYLMDADGRNAAPLTDLPGSVDAFRPVWFPDGARLAFLRMAGDESYEDDGPYLVNADGSGVRQILASFGQVVRVVPRPVGEWVVLDVYLGDGGGEAQLLGRLDRGELCVLVEESFGDPAWSPSGGLLAYSDDRGLWIVTPDGVRRRLVARGVGFSPDWSPSGDRIAWAVPRFD